MSEPEDFKERDELGPGCPGRWTWTRTGVSGAETGQEAWLSTPDWGRALSGSAEELLFLQNALAQNVRKAVVSGPDLHPQDWLLWPPVLSDRTARGSPRTWGPILVGGALLRLLRDDSDFPSSCTMVAYLSRFPGAPEGGLDASWAACLW